jgi:hypothetical protein
MPATVDFDRTPLVQIDPDLDRRPRVCDWDAIEQHRRISPTELATTDWFVVSQKTFRR